ncbi:MAG: hypothetical protein Q4G07_07115 [Oscillospiraceae bacterium]|nr:hypothetical protein [Oscillospiraceae bacterium]
MIYHTTQLVVTNAKAEQFYDFMINPDNDRYQKWFPNEHLAFYITKRGASSHLGDEVYYDEYLGGVHRLKFFAEVVTANRPACAAWQMKRMGLRIPAVLRLELADTPNRLQIDHKLCVGFSGIGKLFDPFIRLYFTKSFADSLSKHCLEECPRLAKYLMN